MRIRFLVAALAFAFAVALAASHLVSAQRQERVELWSDSNAFEIRFGDGEPSLRLREGDDVTFRIQNTGTVAHNFHLGPPHDLVAPKEGFLEPGNETALSFAPRSSGTVAVWCEVHRAAGMEATIVTAASRGESGPEPRPFRAPPGGPPPPDATGTSSVGLPVVLAALAAAAALARKRS
ncbi:MAG: cupredoxin domain-containing protein [Methanobacteriota archaeon]